mgnify:CR=1 FL=1
MSDALARMKAGQWYSCLDPDLESLREKARVAVHQHTTMGPGARGACAPLLRDLIGTFGPDCYIEAPFHCSYGFNTHLADEVYLNAGCTILDSASVSIGSGSMLGPGVHIYCADHHRDRGKRRAGMERALPVAIGADVWIGGRSVILPGVTIDDGAIVAAGAVVTRDVAAAGRVAGVPARPL